MVLSAVLVQIIKLLKFGALKVFIQIKMINRQHAQLVHRVTIALKVR